MSVTTQKLTLTEKLGYSTGDMAANLVWRGALGYLAFFYTNTLGITATAAALLMLSVRISDGITDIGMGMIADRTKSRHGRFRPWIIWSAPVLGLFLVLAFVVPDVSPGMKLAWAYFTYIGLTLAYTVNNVPYSALMGVMTSSHTERSVLSGFRFGGAFLGGLLVMGGTPYMVSYFGVDGTTTDAQGYLYTMCIFAALLVALCIVTFATTKERIEPPKSTSDGGSGETIVTLLVFVMALLGMVLAAYYRTWPFVLGFIVTTTAAWRYKRWLTEKPTKQRSLASNQLIDLLGNKPWLMVLGLGFLTMLFNGIKMTVTAYYFKDYVQNEALIGAYFTGLLATSMFAAYIAGYLTQLMGKRLLFSISLILSGLLSGSMFFLEPDQINMMFVLGCTAEFFAAFMPVLIFSMLGDTIDYSEWKTGRRATGLAYSAGSFIQKTGGGFGGAIILLVLASYGYVGTDPTTFAQATEGMRWLISWIPAGFAFAGLFVLMFYPLNSKKMAEIESDLAERRAAADDSDTVDTVDTVDTASVDTIKPSGLASA